MTGREHSPKPGVTWQQQLVRVEVVVPDGPWPPSDVDVAEGGAVPDMPVLNRRQRRAAQRAARRGGRS